MKKLILILTSLVCSIIFFTGCKKEIEIKEMNDSNDSIQKTLNYYDYLSKTTGINIYELANSLETQKFIESAISIGEEITENMRGDLTEQQIARIQELVELIMAAVENNDVSLVNLYLRELAMIIFSPSHIWLDKPIYECDAIEALNNEVKVFFDFLSNKYQSFDYLEKSLQIEVLNAIYEINDNRTPDCYKSYKNTMTDITFYYGVAIAACGFTGPGYVLCYGAATAIYLYGAHAAMRDYKICTGH